MAHSDKNNKKNIVAVDVDLSEITVTASDFEYVQLDEKIHDTKFETKPIGFFQDAMMRFAKNKASIVAAIIIAFTIFMAIIGPEISGYGYRAINSPANRLPPRIQGLEKLGIFDGSKVIRTQRALIETNYKDAYISTVREYEVQGTPMAEIRVNAYIVQGQEDMYFWFGTDAMGRDIFTRTWRGVRISYIISIVSVLINMTIGVTYGAIEGFYGGKIDLVLQRIVEILNGIPSLPLTLIAIMYFGGASVQVIILAFCLTGWIGYSGTTRIQFYRYKGREYVLASQTMGASDIRLILKHILPNAAGTMITGFALAIPSMIYGEAGLAYLNIGLQPPESSLGIMLMEGQNNLLNYPYMIFPPAIIISAMMISFNLFGNGLRDAFNPSLRGS